MKRKDLERHLRVQGCGLLREGSRHSVFYNSKTNALSTIPRHTEIEIFLVRKVCKDLGIKIPKGR